MQINFFKGVEAPLRVLGFIGVGVVTASYVAGYLVWALLTNHYGLGILPVNTIQFLSAGGVVVGLLVLIMGSAESLRRGFGQTITRKFKKFPRGLVEAGWGAVCLIAATIVAGMVLTFLNAFIPWFSLEPINILAIFGVVGLSVALFYTLAHLFVYYWLGGLFTRAKKGEQGGSNQEKVSNMTGMVTAVMAFVVLFAMNLMPIISPELGGARPTEASFDLDPDDLSSDTIMALWPDWNATWEPGEVVRTPEATVVFYGAQILLVQPAKEDRRIGEPIEIPRAAVKAIIWS